MAGANAHVSVTVIQMWGDETTGIAQHHHVAGPRCRPRIGRGRHRRPLRAAAHDHGSGRSRRRRQGARPLLRRPPSDARLPGLHEPQRSQHHLGHVPEGCGGGSRHVGVHRPHPDRTRCSEVLCPPDQPQPGPLRGRRGPLGPEPRDPRQRRQVRPRARRWDRSMPSSATT